MLKLKQYAKDTITNYQGIITAYAIFASGEATVEITKQTDSEIKTEWISEPRVCVIGGDEEEIVDLKKYLNKSFICKAAPEFYGTCTGAAQYCTGYIRLEITPEFLGKKNKKVIRQWFYVNELRIKI